MEVIFRKIEQRVPEILQIIEQDLDEYSAVHIKLSKLKKQNQSLYQAKMAVNIIHELMADYQGWLIFFLDYDLVGIFKNVQSNEIIKNLETRIREVFITDPLAYFSNGISNPDFAATYEFPFNYKYFKNQLEGKLAKQKPRSIHALTGENIIKTISAGDVNDIERNILDIDVNNVIRKQAICGLLNNRQTLKPVFNEVYISLPRLSRILAFNFEDGANKFLIKYLEEILQRKLIEHLIEDSRILVGSPFSIKISVNIILSELFNLFDRMIKDKIEHPVIIELNASDLLSDMLVSLQAINCLKLLGYKICLSGINEANIKILDRELLKADFGKIDWHNELSLQVRSGASVSFKNAINNFGANRLIINNCNNFEIIELGKQFGINLFQGWECDQM
ncbi:MAG: hypothetical protein K0R49_1822, partial [Burkholderiales bacterium]|nr:hypothetical protein [Burkholderiales bacterium]